MSGLLHATGLAVSLGGRSVLSGVDVAAGPGELVGLLGPNGAGKTTLLRALSGLQAPQAGAVTLDGAPLAAMSPPVLARRLAYLASGNECQWPLVAEALVALGRLPHRTPWSRLSVEDMAAIESAMRFTGVLGLVGRPVTQLSGGELARVLLARALAGDPELLLADEPVAGLDPGHQLDVMALLARRAAGGGTVVVALHDLTLAARFCTRLILLSEGTLLAEGAAEAVLTPENLRAAYGIEATVGTLGGQVAIAVTRP
ncbi:ABC transporter ATP-binding protein [Oceanibaculum indicum]|uniref:ABC transporter-like protein n=1 Tax=Oceanibaculum indicum P24 TaxID=1207063 RepID=K2JGA4_9PROT|nr:ABC transporter ATP-binding protein [Oceanibaculum indicum]EKE73607.1 ABC transporter-like protein [Oceanibaculum indicum P24]